MDPALAYLQREIETLARVIDAPPHSLPTYGWSEGWTARPHLERSGDTYFWVVNERGVELQRKATKSRSELLYWVFLSVTFDVATSWEVRHRVEGEDSRIGVYRKQMELLECLEPAWRTRYREEKAALLATLGLL